jgi:hypothetical protein
MVGLRDIIDTVKLNNIKKNKRLKKKPLFVRNVMARMELERNGIDNLCSHTKTFPLNHPRVNDDELYAS